MAIFEANRQAKLDFQEQNPFVSITQQLATGKREGNVWHKREQGGEMRKTGEDHRENLRRVIPTITSCPFGFLARAAGLQLGALTCCSI